MHPTVRKLTMVIGHEHYPEAMEKCLEQDYIVWHSVLTLTRCTTGLGFSSSATARASVAICHGG